MTYDTGPSITISKKTAALAGFVLLLGIGFALVAWTRGTQGSDPSGTIGTPTPAALASARTSASLDGVDATISGVERGNGQTAVILTLNNHAYDLSAMNPAARSTLSGVAAANYQILSNGGGGHHVESVLTFPGEIAGVLNLVLADGLVFDLDAI